MNIHLPSVNMPPKDFEFLWSGSVETLNLCLEQDYINTNKFFFFGVGRKLQKHALAVKADDFT